MENYKLKICCSSRFYKALDTLKRKFREIDSIKDLTKQGKKMKIYAFDVVLESNAYASKYMIKFILDKSSALNNLKKNSNLFTEENFNFDNYFISQPEKSFVRPNNVNTFLKNYQQGYKYKNSNFKKSYEALKYALVLMPNDIRTLQIFHEVEQNLIKLNI